MLQNWQDFILFIPLLLAVAGGCSKTDDPGFLVTAHRGASGLAPENTIAAIQEAIKYRANYAEIDVHLTADGEVVLMHDDSVNRTTNGEGNIWELTMEELEGLDAGSWFSAEFAGEPVPTLRDVIRLASGKIKLNIEIKVSEEEPDIASAVVGIIRTENFTRFCMVTSFDRETVEEVRRIAPEIVTGLIFGRDYPADVMEGEWEVLSCNQEIVNQNFVNRAKEEGKIIHVWTVNDEMTMMRLIDLKVDGIITNYPGLLYEVLATFNLR